MVTIPGSYFDQLAQIESGGRPYVKASTSSASGLYQFIRSTWEGMGGTWGPNPNEAFGGLRPTLEEQTQRVQKLTSQNASYLMSSGITVSPASLYAAHFLGAGTAARVLSANPNTMISNVVGQGPIKANPFMKGMTVGDFWNWLTGKKGLSANPFDGGGSGNASGSFPCPHCGGRISYGK